MDLEREYLLQNYARYPLVLARGKGCYLYDLAGKRYLDFISGIGVNALGHAHPRLTKVIREQAAPADPHLESLLSPVSGPAGQAAGADERIAALLLLQLRHRGDGRRAQDGALPRPRHRPGKVRGDRAGEFLPRAQLRRALDHRPGQVPPGFRTAGSRRALRARQRHRGAGSRLQRPHRRHRAGNDPGRGRHQSADARSSSPRRASLPTATTPCWSPTRPSAAWDAPAPTSPTSAPARHHARRDGDRQAAGLRHSAGRDHGQREGRGHDQAGHARHHFRRRRAGLPRGAGILRHSGRTAALHPARGRLLPRGAERTGAQALLASRKSAASA